jgi:hypothetical protein
MAIKKVAAFHRAEPQRVLDLCAGTGCIGLAVAHRVKDSARVTLGETARRRRCPRGEEERGSTSKLTGPRELHDQLDAKKPGPGLSGGVRPDRLQPALRDGKKEMETLAPLGEGTSSRIWRSFGGEDGLDFLPGHREILSRRRLKARGLSVL